ncbi:fumarate hydratase [Ructibacterium gallinarum]|uniref:Fumarate hydratase n=1 Tax=Ructibacterium gallinarum TaxID=2779355 RepID=A0A9D5M0V1_9FIRM|nr:fumarate hydratase [Ructibacterium gallinarum]MBE5040215.1 fumarate hydratase [Ructibacterium gallinarum]
MREITAEQIIQTVRDMCIEANCNLNADVHCALKQGLARETNETAKSMLTDILKNAEIAKEEQIPICQDTGMAVFFLKLGQEVHITGGLLTDAINEGVRKGYAEGYLRKSVVADPIRRGNTGDNTPAVIHTEIVPGDRLEIELAPKGFGSENMSRIKMLKPSEGLEGIIDFVVETVRIAGGNPCPPLVVGVGIGGTFEKCALLAKSALLREIGSQNPDPYYAELEKTLLEKINGLDIGPQGFGGVTTALGVQVETFPTHIAGMPCAVNISCHVTRHVSKIL